MSWETIHVAIEELDATLRRIRDAGSTITHCTPTDGEFVVTYCIRKGAA